eukprot:2028500-Prymnesium_polylepis.1
MSSPPSAGVMKPKPFCELNHLTVPVTTAMVLSAAAAAGRRQGHTRTRGQSVATAEDWSGGSATEQCPRRAADAAPSQTGVDCPGRQRSRSDRSALWFLPTECGTSDPDPPAAASGARAGNTELPLQRRPCV